MHLQSRYRHLTLDDRRKIYVLTGQKKSISEIAAYLGRNQSTIYREINRNTHSHEDPVYRGYFPVTANDFARGRRWRGRKLSRSKPLKAYVADRLREYWSPEQIAGYLQRQAAAGFYACHETIYQYVYSSEGKENSLYRYLYRSRPRRRPKFGRKQRNPYIAVENTIHDRPESINNRTTFGHWECDLMIFMREHGNANVTSMIERKSRYTVLARNDNRSSGAVLSLIGKCLKTLPQASRQTMTFDRGFEFRSYPLLQRHYGIHSYFCDPQKPWQKGAVENNNGRLRRFLPANMNVATMPEDYLHEICLRMNNTPRKCLQYRTPQEVFMEHLQRLSS